MVRKFLLPLILLLLCTAASGCSYPGVPSSYSVTAEHTDSSRDTSETAADALNASTYEELEDAVLTLVEQHIEQGTIRVSASYTGDVGADASNAVYHVWKNEPLGAWAIDYISASHTQLLSYYEIQVSVTYRKTAAEMEAIQTVRSTGSARSAIETALEAFSPTLTLRYTGYSDTFDCAAIAAAYCAANPESMIEAPSVSYAVYPDSGNVRIVDITFSYQTPASSLREMRSAVTDVISSAVSYVRFRDDPAVRAEMLYSYLKERFDYVEAETPTPLYSLLCEGIYSNQTLAEVYTLLCSRIGIPCVTVAGYSDGTPYYWNLVTLGEISRHVDLTRDFKEDRHSPTFYLDSDLPNFSWDRTLYPECVGSAESTVPTASPDEPPENLQESDAEEDPPEDSAPTDASPTGTES